MMMVMLKTSLISRLVAKAPTKKTDFCFALKIQIILGLVYSKVNKDLNESL
jgi:hypothetical protein